MGEPVRIRDTSPRPGTRTSAGIVLFRFGGVVSRAGAGVLPLSWDMAWGGVGWGVWCVGWALTTLLNVLLYTSGACSRRLTGVVNPEVALQTAKRRSRPGGGAADGPAPGRRSRRQSSAARPGVLAWRAGAVEVQRAPSSTPPGRGEGAPARRTTPSPGRRRPRRPENVLVRPTTTCAGRVRPRKPETLPNVEGLGMMRTFSADQHLPNTTPPARHRPHPPPRTSPPAPHRPRRPSHNHREHRNPDQSRHAGSTTPSNLKSRWTPAAAPGWLADAAALPSHTSTRLPPTRPGANISAAGKDAGADTRGTAAEKSSTSWRSWAWARKVRCATASSIPTWLVLALPVKQ